MCGSHIRFCWANNRAAHAGVGLRTIKASRIRNARLAERRVERSNVAVFLQCFRDGFWEPRFPKASDFTVASGARKKGEILCPSPRTRLPAEPARSADSARSRSL